jgi:ABC-2 type transport system ATP-binding protein
VLLVRIDDDEVYDRIRDTVAELDLSLHRVERQRHQVADLFRDLPEGANHA